MDQNSLCRDFQFISAFLICLNCGKRSDSPSTCTLLIQECFICISIFLGKECQVAFFLRIIIFFKSLDCCLTRVCLMIGKPALQSKPKKRLMRKEKKKNPFTSNHHPTHFILLSPGEHVLKVLCHWNHIGRLKTTLCGTPDALTVYYHPLKPFPRPGKVHSPSHDLAANGLIVPRVISMKKKKPPEHVLFASAVSLSTPIQRNECGFHPKYAGVSFSVRNLGVRYHLPATGCMYIVHVSYTAACSCIVKSLLCPAGLCRALTCPPQ